VFGGQGYTLHVLVVQTQVVKSNSPVKLVDPDLDLHVLAGKVMM